MNRATTLQRCHTVDTPSKIETTKQLQLRRCRTSKEECRRSKDKTKEVVNEMNKTHHSRASRSPNPRQRGGHSPGRSSLSNSPRRRSAVDVRISQIQQVLLLPVAQDLFPEEWSEIEAKHDEKEDDQECSYIPWQLTTSDIGTKQTRSPKRVSGFLLSKMSSLTKLIALNDDKGSLLGDPVAHEEEGNHVEPQNLLLGPNSAHSMVGMDHDAMLQRRQQRQRRDLSKKCASGKLGSLRKVSTL